MELYNLTADPFEQHDVAAAHQKLLVKLKTLLSGEGLSCTCYQC